MLSGECEQAGSVLREDHASTGHWKNLSTEPLGMETSQKKTQRLMEYLLIQAVCLVAPCGRLKHSSSDIETRRKRNFSNHGEAFPHSPHA